MVTVSENPRNCDGIREIRENQSMLLAGSESIGERGIPELESPTESAGSRQESVGKRREASGKRREARKNLAEVHPRKNLAEVDPRKSWC